MRYRFTKEQESYPAGIRGLPPGKLLAAGAAIALCLAVYIITSRIAGQTAAGYAVMLPAAAGGMAVAPGPYGMPLFYYLKKRAALKNGLQYLYKSTEGGTTEDENEGTSKGARRVRKAGQ